MSNDNRITRNSDQSLTTIVEILKKRASTDRDRIGYRFLTYSKNNTIVKSITYGELDGKARAIAAYLQKNNVSGKCAILLYPGGLDFITAFFGCLYAKVIPVPLYHFISKRKGDRIKAIVEDSQAKIFLSDSSNIENVNSYVKENFPNDDYKWLATDTINDADCEKFSETEIQPGDLAYLQYTSGSTSTPKGVMITHKNILHNIDLFWWHYKLAQESVGVGWLPHFHDMGLVIMILLPLSLGYQQVLMQPGDFLTQPYRFLKAISDYRGTISPGPNFSYDYCAASVTDEQCKTLDLSSMESFINGAEPVHWETIENFNKKFEPCGLKQSVLYPGYGMAETTLVISSRFPFPEDRVPVYIDIDREIFEKENKAVLSIEGKDSIRYPSNGRVRDDVKLIIVDTKTLSICPDGSVGEVWLSYDSVSPGYWRKEKETEETFRAFTRDTGEGPFLRTGDLGFLVKGELYLCGRLKDIFIIRGTNYYPNDIEFTVGHCHEAFVPDSSAAFSLEIENEEKLFIVQEVKRTRLKDINPEEAFGAIREAVADVHGLQVYGILLLRFGQIHKTSSGKIQRKRCKQSYLNGEFEVLCMNISGKTDNDAHPASSAIARLMKLDSAERSMAIMNQLTEIISGLLKIDATMVNKPKKLIMLGIDSFSVSVLKQKIEDLFNYPITIAEIYNSGVDGLAEIISSHLSEHTRKAGRLPKIVADKANRFEEFPLTDLQHAYWIGRHGAFELGGFGTHAYLEITAEGYDLDYARLNAAWTKLIERHDMLHAVFTSDAKQRIMEEIPEYNIKLNDLRHLSEEDRQKELEKVRNDLSHQVFSYDQWPLFDIRMTVLEPKKKIIHISMDLLIADIWSLNSLFMEWKLMYDEKYDQSPKIDVSFRDYSLAMEDMVETEVYKKAEAYWKERIASFPPAPQLPQVKSVRDLKEIKFVHRLYKLPRADWAALKAKAVKYAVTPTVLVMAVFAKIMSIWSRSKKFTLNLTLFNRLGLHPDINNVIGDFTSSILVEVDNSRTLNFKDLVTSLQDQITQDMEYRYYSGINVIRDIVIKNKEPAMKPLMPIVFTTALSGDNKMVFNSPTAFFGKNTYSISQTSQVWLDNQIYENEDHVAMSWDAIDELFPPGMLDDMFATYTSLVRQIAVDDLAWERDIRTLIPVEQLKRHVEFNTTGNEPPDELLITRFIENAKTNPDAPAVITSTRTINYGQLANSAAIIAHKLKSLGVKKGELVAVRMLKGWEQISAAVGVLLSGGAYLSIDPGLPSARQEYILGHGQARIILTTQKTARIINPGENIVQIDIEESILEADAVDIPEPPQSADDPAYVLYTSGSTGQPKGAMLSHRNALNTIVGVNALFDVTSADRTFAISSLSFDLSVYDVFGMLYAGGSMVIPDSGTERDPDHWFSLIDKHKVTIWNSVPALMELLVENVQTYKLMLGFRCVFLSGDWIPVNLPEKIWKINRDIKVISLGGPTECAIWQAWYPIEFIDGAWKSIPYGKPLPNQRIYIMNEHLGECPDWVPGELYIGGSSVGLNYFHDEEKSAQAFIVHPETNERMYKSGDLGRFIPDPGYIEFLGREDFQVKIGGFRIELGEIENILNDHPKVRRAAVKKVENKKGNVFLAAYVVLNTLGKLEMQKSNAKSETNLAEEIIGDGETKLLLDQEERLAFKMSDPGIRKIEGNPVTLEAKEVDIATHYIHRGNSRRFLKTPVSSLAFSHFLSCLKKTDYEGLKKYRYGSAGGLYPVQVYVYVKDDMVEGLKGGSYYYNPIKHVLVEIGIGNESGHEIHVPTNRDIFKTSAFTIFLVGKMPAIKPFYGVKARDFCLIEAGLITQLLETAGVEQGIGLCQIGAILHEDNIRQLLKLEDDHILLHTIIGGSVDYSDHLRGLPFTEDNYGSSKKGDNKLSEEFQEHCRAKLPHYMVPNTIMYLDNLPLTTANKVNYKALPEPVQEKEGTGTTAPKPQGELEKIIFNIFSEQSGVPNLDVNLSLFEMGINSLTVIKIWRAIMNEIKIDFPVTRIFENPTISGLVRYLANQHAGDDEDVEGDKDVEDKVSKKKAALKKRLVAQQSKSN